MVLIDVPMAGCVGIGTLGEGCARSLLFRLPFACRDEKREFVVRVLVFPLFRLSRSRAYPDGRSEIPRQRNIADDVVAKDCRPAAHIRTFNISEVTGMKKLAYTLLSALLVWTLVGIHPASAQMDDAHKAELEKLMRFEGEWKAEEAGLEGTRGNFEFEMTLEVIPIIEGNALEFSIRADIAEVGLYVEKDFLTFDYMEEKVTLMSVSNFGEVGTYAGSWDPEEEGTLHLSGTKMYQGKQFISKITIVFEDDDVFTWKVETSLGGEVMGRFQARFEED
jgi:hypothetical protein